MTGGDVLRPARSGIGPTVTQWALGQIDVVFALLRAVWPIAHVGRTFLVTRHDDVREVFLADADFPVPYGAKMDVIMGGAPFFLGMDDGPEYRRDTSAMRMAMRRDDIPSRLVPAVAERARAIVAGAGGRLEVVDTLARTLTFDVLCEYFGVGAPAQGDLRVWATRLFEFQFADSGNDPSLRQEVDVMAPALRAHIDALIAERHQAGGVKGDVLGRCLELQARGLPGFSDVQIRSALIGFIVGGLPQPPMVVPQALDQLLRRPDALAGAQRAARENDDALLEGYVFEALRFDPLAPALPRLVRRDHVVAEGTPREKRIPAGATMMASIRSAMMDHRRVGNPRRFNPCRPRHEYLHFGHSLHECFARHINHALIPQMLKPLLQYDQLRRAGGPEGRLKKRGIFAERLWVEFGQSASAPARREMEAGSLDPAS